MNKADFYYKKNIKLILDNKNIDYNPRPKYKDGTPAHTLFITGIFEEYNLTKNEFPIPTIRNTAIKTGIKEILWIYQKQDNKLCTARELGINWWDNWNIGDDTIGNRYGFTVNKWDLMNRLLYNLEKDPFSRRHIMNLYQEDDLNNSKGLFPCAYETLWSVRRVNDIMYLDMTLIQRSNDFLIAGYINKIQYVALLMMVAGHLNYTIGNFCHLVQNLHIYDRHITAANELLNKESLDIEPYIILKSNKNFYEYTIDDFEIKHLNGISKINSELEIAI